MNRITKLAAIGGILLLSLVTLMPATSVGAVNAFKNCTGANQDTTICKAADSEKDATKMVTAVTNLLFFALGTIAVIVIIIGGIRYATSGGDSSAVKGAKDTILYAVVGLVIAMLAYAIVNFVVNRFV